MLSSLNKFLKLKDPPLFICTLFLFIQEATVGKISVPCHFRIPMTCLLLLLFLNSYCLSMFRSKCKTWISFVYKKGINNLQIFSTESSPLSFFFSLLTKNCNVFQFLCLSIPICIQSFVPPLFVFLQPPSCHFLPLTNSGFFQFFPDFILICQILCQESIINSNSKEYEIKQIQHFDLGQKNIMLVFTDKQI